MPTLEEILASLEDEDAAAIKSALAEKDKAAQIAKRDLELAKNHDLKDRFPRAWRAYSKGKLALGDAVAEAELVDKFKTMELELAELGVPASEAPVAQPPAGAAPAATAPDPAAAFGEGVGGGAAPTTARNLEQEFEETMKSGITDDRVRLVELWSGMNEEQRARMTDRLGSPESPMIRRSRGI